jgi:vacuolar-type H+-ATPase subunit C/Vma6
VLRRWWRYPYAAVRSRALAAGFLQSGNFEEMARLPSVDEVQARMREWTAGRREFYDGPEGPSSGFSAFGRSIVRTLTGPDRALVEGYLSRVEVENLKVLARGVLGKRDEAEVRAFLVPVEKRALCSFQGLAKVRTFEELVAKLPRHPFRAIFRAALELSGEKRLFTLETGLDRVFWGGIAGLLKKLDFLDRMGAKEILSLRADIDRFNVVHRGLRAGLEEGVILGALPALGAAYPETSVRKALRSASPDEALSAIFPVPGTDRPLSAEGEMALRKRLQRHLRRVLRSHPFDLSVPMAALLLKEIELQDLAVVMNGVRLFRAGRIDKLLTTPKGG